MAGTDIPQAGPPPMTMDEPIPEDVKRRRRVRNLALGAVPVILLAVLIAFLAFRRSADMTVAAGDIRIAAAESVVMTESASFVGRATPRNLVQIGAPETGRVAEVVVRSGDRVARGQVLLRLSNPERELAVSDRMARIRSDIFIITGRRADLNASQAADRRATLQAEYDRIEVAERLRRQEILLNSGVVSEAHLRPLRDRLVFAERVVAENRAVASVNAPIREQQRAAIGRQLAALQADYAAAARQRDAFTVTAPASGALLGLDVTVGQAIDGGAQLAQIDPMEGVLIVAQLDEYYAARVRPGQTAGTRLQGRTYRLVVSHVSPDVRDGTFRVELEFADGARPPLRPGETIQGVIEFPGGGRFVAVPSGPYLEQTGGNYLFVVNEAGTAAARRPVRTGIRAPDRVAVTRGVAAGERVIVSSYRQFGDARTLRIAGR